MISGSNEQLQQQSEHTLLKPDCHRWWISKIQSGREDTLEERYAIKFCFKLAKNAPETYEMLFDSLAWIEHYFFFLTGRKAGSLRGMMRDKGGVKKSIDQSWFAKGLALGLLCWGFNGVQEAIPSERPALFKSAQWHFHQDNAPVHNSMLVTDYLTKTGIKTVPHRPYLSRLAPCDFWLFPKLRGCRYETIDEMEEAVTKVVDRLTQEDFDGAFQKLLERYKKCISARGD